MTSRSNFMESEHHCSVCYEIARFAHRNQYRRGGEPYINHCVRTAEVFDCYIDKSIAYLHDVLEDTEVTEDYLRGMGVYECVIECVNTLTRIDGQSYADYITLIMQSDTCSRVKIADMLDNLSDDPTENQKKKYKKSIMLLINRWSDQ